MTRPKLKVVDRATPIADRGCPHLIAMLERLLFEARCGNLTAMSAVIERDGVIDMEDCHIWNAFEAAGMHTWATNAILAELDEDDE